MDLTKVNALHSWSCRKREKEEEISSHSGKSGKTWVKSICTYVYIGKTSNRIYREGLHQRGGWRRGLRLQVFRRRMTRSAKE